MRAGRVVWALVLAVAALVVLDVAPAAADPARPTSDRSTVERVEPPVAGVSLEVVGGDAFLALRVEPGVEVAVPGYGGEPYLRVRADGTVERNRRSRATYLNEDRLGDAPAPADLDPGDEPEWERVGSGGSYAWHDHRIHWMSPDRPPGLEPGDVIDPAWEVPIVVDGEPVTVTGSLVWEEGVPTPAWLAAIAVVGLAAFALVRRRSLAAVPAGLAAVAATAVGLAEWRSIPEGAGGSPLVVAVPLVGVAAVGAGLALRGRGPGRGLGASAPLVAAAAVLGWAALRMEVLLEPVLPTGIDPDLDRAGTVVATGLALATAAVGIWRPRVAPRPGGGHPDEM